MVDTEEEVPEAVELTSITQDDLNEAMASLKTSMTTEVKSMLKELLEGMKSTPDPLLVVNPTTSESEANSAKEAAKGTHVPSPHDKNGTGTFASVPPPPVYGGPVPTPRINIHGPPPKLVKGDFSNWVFRIKSHLNHCSTNLWRIIEQGFYPHDPNNFTPREEVDNQYNHSALFILQDAVLPKIFHIFDTSLVQRIVGSTLCPCTREAQASNGPTLKWSLMRPMNL